MNKKKPLPDWLFIGTYPNAYIYADSTRETRGDFHEIARVYFNKLELKIYDNSPKYAVAVERAKSDYKHLLDHINEPIVVSATGQTTKASI